MVALAQTGAVGHRTCAYCPATGPLTREHLFSDFLLADYPGYRTFVQDFRSATPFKGPPTIKDVCRRCNNERLAALDGYATTLNRRYFSTEYAEASLLFEYDFEFLARWLLKILYNFARVERRQVDVHAELVPHILDGRPPAFPLSLLMGLIGPSDCTSFERAHGLGPSLFPHLITSGWVHVPEPPSVALGRMVSVNQFLFVVVAWRESPTDRDTSKMIQAIADYNRLLILDPQETTLAVKDFCTSARAFLSMTSVGRAVYDMLAPPELPGSLR